MLKNIFEKWHDFFQITSENKCFDVRLHREFAIEDAKPATVKVYDYYEQGKCTEPNLWGMYEYVICEHLT